MNVGDALLFLISAIRVISISWGKSMHLIKKLSHSVKILLVAVLLVNQPTAKAISLGWDSSTSDMTKIKDMAIVVGVPATIMAGGVVTLVTAGIMYYQYIARQNSRAQVAKEEKRVYYPGTIKENFNSVAGAEEAKEELREVVEFLKDPEYYNRLGAKVPRGVLLCGDPGNGKTLLARAVAGEANCAFISVNGSEFINIWIGLGAATVRELFSKARQYRTCIIFIDEIDSIGGKRSNDSFGGDKEYAQTLNQLLAEMDGFHTKESNIVVIGATNRSDMLDDALVRPGRFDRKVQVPYPDLNSREKILRLHAKNKKIDAAIDFKQLAQATPGFSGAELANLINEAALQAAKNKNQHVITQKDIEEARDKIIMGQVWKTAALTPEERRVTAYHEAGHTLVTVLQRDLVKPLHKVTILPRGRSMGATYSLAEGEEQFSRSREQMLADIRVGLAGRAAEEYMFGKKSTGAENDFGRVTRIARHMVCKMGMSDEVGEIIYDQNNITFKYAQKTIEKIDAAVEEIVRDCMAETRKMIIDNADKLEALAQALLEQETLNKQAVYDLVGIMD